ncbi:hypothetical protein NDU88_001057 [Pleurodeles waltl]|uniref:Uncharacterized protein n=1 Tax=Pleurodeles waltl TaxID=8319 RepID=A0AAV7MIP0_PLEWA|nr:hypothetical protein NDU88_001057 [Pleurodeles waltl]
MAVSVPPPAPASRTSHISRTSRNQAHAAARAQPVPHTRHPPPLRWLRCTRGCSSAPAPCPPQWPAVPQGAKKSMVPSCWPPNSGSSMSAPLLGGKMRCVTPPPATSGHPPLGGPPAVHSRSSVMPSRCVSQCYRGGPHGSRAAPAPPIFSEALPQGRPYRAPGAFLCTPGTVVNLLGPAAATVPSGPLLLLPPRPAFLRGAAA